MKFLFAITLSLVLTSQAFAVTSEQFVNDFVEQFNHNVALTNEERAAEGKTQLYCEALSAEQVQLVVQFASVADTTVAQFSNDLADKLTCYPIFWAPWGRKNVRGMLFNTKSYVMDYMLIIDTLTSLNDGRKPHDETLLLKSYNPNWPY